MPICMEHDDTSSEGMAPVGVTVIWRRWPATVYSAEEMQWTDGENDASGKGVAPGVTVVHRQWRAAHRDLFSAKIWPLPSLIGL
jgi:hypothetical protein